MAKYTTGKDGGVEVEFDRFDDVVAKIPAMGADLRKKLAIQIDGTTKRNIVAVNAVDTGFMLNSVYTSDEGGSTFDAAVGAARAMNPKALTVEEEEPGPNETIVGLAAEYAVHIEFGTQRAEARPFFVPAVEEVRALAESMAKGLGDKL